MPLHHTLHRLYTILYTAFTPYFTPSLHHTLHRLYTSEDTAKYLRNLDVKSAYYDPKTRSM